MFLVTKIINNNVILALNKAKQEVIILGKGIGFNSRPGQFYQATEQDEIFTKPQSDDVYQFIDSIPLEIISLTNEVIKHCQRVLSDELSDSLIITLAEHLMYAIKRNQSEQETITLYEVPYLYPNEYQAGQMAVAFINQQYALPLPLSEAPLIALHFVNARINNKSVGDTLRLTQIMFKIVNIIDYAFHIKIDTSSDNFARFTNHLKYLLVRCKNNRDASTKVSPALSGLVEKELLKNYSCARKIAQLIQTTYNFIVHPDEIIYLALHIERLLTTE